jgi:hypothetical protein
MNNYEKTEKPAEQLSMAFDDMLTEAGQEAASEAESTSIALFSDAVALSAEDVVIPRLRLMQGLSKEVQEGTAKPGEWVLTGVPPTDTIEATVIAVAKFRRYLDPADGSVLCRSEDGQNGVGQPGGVCEACELSKWVNASTPGGKNTPPQCQFGYRYLLDVVGYGNCVFEMKRSAIPAAKALNGMIVRSGYGTTKIMLRSQKSTAGKGTFYAPVVIPMK